MHTTSPLSDLSAIPAPAPSPPVVLDVVRCGGREVYVARDDLLPGGTKERGLAPMVHALARRGVRRFVYASPFCGYAQIALASVGRAAECDVVLFCERVPGRGTLHAYSRQAEELGACVVPCASLAEAEERATAFAAGWRGARKLPLGFACPEFHGAYESALAREWRRVVARMGATPECLFVPVGSGTLLRAFARVVPRSVEIHAIDVNVLGPRDPRIASLDELPGVTLHRAPERFADPSRVSPSFPSNPFYDAKLLPFVTALTRGPSLWWNVAR